MRATRLRGIAVGAALAIALGAVVASAPSAASILPFPISDPTGLHPSVIVDPSPALSISTSASPSSYSSLGQVIDYSFVVTNTGNVTMTTVTATVGAFSGAGTVPTVSCPTEAASMAPSESVTCSASYTITQSDLDAGLVFIEATATGTPPAGPDVTTPPSGFAVTASSEPALSIQKSASPSDPASFVVGQVVTYSFLVTNSGNVTLAAVTIIEGTFTGSGSMSVVTCPPGAASLPPTAAVNCTATYTITQADVDAGSITNDATATAAPPSGPNPVSTPSTVTVPGASNPGLALVKTASPATVSTVGELVTYSFVVTNVGNTTLTGVAIDETAFSGDGTAPSVTCPPEAGSLVPAAQVTCTATYVAVQADLDAGSIVNTAVAIGTPPTGDLTVSPPSSVAVTTAALPPVTAPPASNPLAHTGAAIVGTLASGSLLLLTGVVLLAARRRRRNADQ